MHHIINNTSLERRGDDVAALILIENMETGRSPDRYGALTLEEQFQIARAEAQRHGLQLQRLITLWDVPDNDRESRLANMLDCLKERPARFLIVPSSLYRGFTRTLVRQHRRVLNRHGTTLLITEK
ncbi:hypothetical protein ITJ43_03495 [Microbacterium sp. VKM Ac-2870]|uniref:hypothetical protein n=1 Tax=Microbacterium sp. VKM Ac-2870 TaxID=2783825 RepID=UPI00188CFA0C|nr:hypothetical protein [Microbacterium sp. VKM Ac-2870]MBF4561191.1 hypothetical protein [Microbacterium sp. VKM Ac-2870]